MENNKEEQNKLEKHSTVKYKGGWFHVSSMTATTVNLQSMTSGRILFKKIPIDDVREDEQGWSEHWRKSESYQSM